MKEILLTGSGDSIADDTGKTVVGTPPPYIIKIQGKVISKFASKRLSSLFDIPACPVTIDND